MKKLSLSIDDDTQTNDNELDVEENKILDGKSLKRLFGTNFISK